MLILSRKVHESIVIDGQITVTVLRVAGDVVKLGIAAPAAIPVHRQEIFDEIKKNQSSDSTVIRPQPLKPPSDNGGSPAR